jgi:hypothetical protein
MMSSASVLTSLLKGGWLTTTSYSSGFHLKTKDSALMAADPRYTASAQIAQKTPSLTALPLQCACLLRPLPSNGCCMADNYAVTA